MSGMCKANSFFAVALLCEQHAIMHTNVGAALDERIVHGRDKPVDDPAAARRHGDDKQVQRREAALKRAATSL